MVTIGAAGFGSDVRRPNAASELLGLIRDVERLRNQLDGVQARLEVDFRRAQVRMQQDAGVPRELQGRGVAEEIALARGVSPKRAGDQLAVRRVLVESMPRVFDQVMSGAVSGWEAEQAAQVALVLDEEQRGCLDAELAPRLGELSPASVKGAARRIADRLDQEAAVRRLERAESQRHVSIRPVADGMVRLSALLPTRAGVAAFAALTKHAATAAAGGVPRTKGQMMADALVERITGAADPADVPVEIQLLMTDRTLLAGAQDTALLEGHAIPAEAARALALRTEEGTKGPGATGAAAPLRHLRRLFTDPVSGRLTGMDARRRGFTGAVREFIKARDQRCRVPSCGAPIRDIDHVHRYADGGETTIENGVGLCQRHNLTKEMPGWGAELDENDGTLRTTSPAGLIAVSPVPNLHALTGPPLGSMRAAGLPSSADPPGISFPPDTEIPPDMEIPADDVVEPGDELSEAELIELLDWCYKSWGLTA